MSETITSLYQGNAEAFVASLLAPAGVDTDALISTLKRSVGLLQKAKSAESANDTGVKGEDAFVMEMPEVSCHTPRGRYEVLVGRESLVLQPKALPKRLHIPFESIRYMLKVEAPNPYSRKDLSADYFVLGVDPAPKPAQGGKAVPVILLHADRNGFWEVPRRLDDAKFPETFVGSPSEVISSLLRTVASVPLLVEDDKVFATVVTGASHVSCYSGVKDGHLWPLGEGLLFVKPPRFIAESDIVGIACGRGGSAGGTRYVDLTITLDGGDEESPTTVEFSNIDRQELPALDKYVKWLTLKRIQDNAKEEKKVLKKEEVPVKPEAPDTGAEVEEITPPPQGRPSRKASAMARAATRAELTRSGDVSEDDDDDEEDEDFALGQQGGDGGDFEEDYYDGADSVSEVESEFEDSDLSGEVADDTASEDGDAPSTENLEVFNQGMQAGQGSSEPSPPAREHVDGVSLAVGSVTQCVPPPKRRRTKME